MTTLSVIADRAFRESQLLDIDVAATASQKAEAVSLLKGIIARHIRPPVLNVFLGNNISQLFAQRGDIIRDFTPYLDRLAIPQDVYVNCYLTLPTSISLPMAPSDGSRLVFRDNASVFSTFPLTLVGNGNLVDGGASLVLSGSGATTSIMYRRDLANWIILTDLTSSQNVPYPEEFDDLFVIELAMRINPRYGATLNPITAEMYAEIRSRFKGRYQTENSSASPDTLWTSNRAWSGDLGRAI